jgi:hypothetical protein
MRPSGAGFSLAAMTLYMRNTLRREFGFLFTASSPRVRKTLVTGKAKATGQVVNIESDIAVMRIKHDTRRVTVLNNPDKFGEFTRKVLGLDSLPPISGKCCYTALPVRHLEDIACGVVYRS